MGSVIDYIECPNCKTEAHTDFYYKTGEEYTNCNNCGYYRTATIKNRDKKLSELTGDDWEVNELKDPYGAFRYKMAGEIGTSCGSLATADDADRFRAEMKLEYQEHIEFAQISRLVGNEIVVEDVVITPKIKAPLSNKVMNTIDHRYQALLQDILDNGVTKQDRTGTGTISVFGRQIRHNMKDGFPLLTTKKMAWKQIVTELLWFLRGDTNIKFLVDNNCHIWDGDAYKNWVLKNSEPDQYWLTKEEFINRIKTEDEFAKKWGDLGPIYGKQWRNWQGWLVKDGKAIGSLWYDQIARLVNDLQKNPDSRRLMVNAWNVGELDQMVLPPCHYGFQVYTRELSLEERCNAYIKWSNDSKWVEWKNHIEKEMGWDYEKPSWVFDEVRKGLNEAQFPTRAISLMWNQRSVDTFLGLPFNIASYGLLLQMLATEVGMIPDELIGNLGDVHLYADHIEQAKEQMEREPFELPTVFINTEFWQTEYGDCGVGPLASNLKGIEEGDFRLMNYQSHPAIKAPLSN